MTTLMNADSRVFPAVGRDLYLLDDGKAGWCDGTDQCLAIAVLALNRRKINVLSRLTGIGQDGASKIARLCKYHASALDAELNGLICRADFYWRQAHRQLTRLAKSPAVWEEALAAISEAPTAPLRDRPLKVAESLVSEIFIDMHRALLRGYLSKAEEPDAIDRGFAHLDYAWSVVPNAGWSDPEAVRILGADSIRLIEAGIRFGQWRQAQSLGSLLLLRAPEETAYQDALARTYVAEANARLTHKIRKDKCMADVATLARSLYKIKKLRLNYPHNLCLFESAAKLHLLRAQRLSDAGQLSEALLDAQAAVTYQPDLSEGDKLRAQIEVEIQRIRVQIAAPESERPTMTKREGAVLAEQAAKGFRLADAFRRSDEARAAEDDLPVARGRRLWEELGLPSLERVDHRPLALQDAFDTILHSPPSAPSGIPAAWDWVSRDNPHLDFPDRTPVYACVQEMIFGNTAALAPDCKEDLVPTVLSQSRRRSSEPFLEWLASSESRWLKLQCVAVVLLAATAGFCGIREFSHRQIRSSAYTEIHSARSQDDYLKTMDAAERFLGSEVIGRDTRTTEVEGLYSEALVRWFEQEQPSVDNAKRRLNRFRQLTGYVQR